MMKDDIDDPKAWKVILDVDQSVLKFTSLRGEFAKMDEGFYVQNNGPMTWHSNITGKDGVKSNMAESVLQDDTKFFKVEALQKWGAAGKFQTFERYAQLKQNDFGKAKELQLGIGFQYTPNLWFGVDYIKCDGLFQRTKGYIDPNKEDKVIRFRTILNF